MLDILHAFFERSAHEDSVINILRRVYTFKDILPALSTESLIHSKLQQIFSYEGTNTKQSTSNLRWELDKFQGGGGQSFSSGNQQDCKEFLDCLLLRVKTVSCVFYLRYSNKSQLWYFSNFVNPQ